VVIQTGIKKPRVATPECGLLTQVLATAP